MNEEERQRNPGTQKPFKCLETGETVWRFRGGKGFVPIEEPENGIPKVKANGKVPNKDESVDLIKIAIRTLEMAMRQMERNGHA